MNKQKNYLLLLFVLLSLSPFVLRGQNYGNEWIKKDQKYFKVKITSEGLYRIDYTTLATIMFQNGVDLSTVNPKKIQIFNEGAEIPIYIDGEDDNVFNFNDYIEFYGKPNDGRLDKELFYTDPVNDPLHDAIPLFSDTGVYFLTFLANSDAQNGKRLQNIKESTFSGLSDDLYFKFRSAIYLKETYYLGHPEVFANVALYYPEYTEGEGWTGNRFGYAPSVNTYRDFVLNAPHSYAGGFDPILDFKVITTSSSVINPDHNLEIEISKDGSSFTSVFDTIADGYGVIRKTLKFAPALIQGANSPIVRMQALNISGVALQAYNPSYVTLDYAREFNMAGFTAVKGKLQPAVSDKLITWENYGVPSVNYEPLIYDLTNGRRISPVFESSNKVKFINRASANESHFVMYDKSSISFITNIEVVKFADVQEAENNTQFLIVTSNSLLGKEATDYLNYRRTSFAANMYSVEQLYDVFTYGIQNPVAVRRFVRYLIDKSPSLKPEYLLFLGRGIQADLLGNASMKAMNKVPILGSPASDILYTAGLGGKQNTIPYLATGRLAADSKSDIGVYLEKLIEQEQSPNAHWKKQVMHLGGGNDGSESKIIKSYLEFFEKFPEAANFGGNVRGYYRSAADVAVDVNIRDNSVKNINEGLSLITFLGHGSATVLDVDIGDTTDYTNKGKLPVMYFNGCRAGNPAVGLNNGGLFYGERMIRAREKGAIVFIGQTSVSELGTLGTQIRTFYEEMFGRSMGQSVGKILNSTIESNLNYNSPLSRMHNTFIFYQGDPAYTIYNPSLPDYFVTPSSLFIEDQNVNALNDSFRLGIIVGNSGRYNVEDSFRISIKRTWPNNTKVEEYQFTTDAVAFLDTIYFTFRTKDIATTGNNIFEVELNPEKTVLESDYSNNKVKWEKYIEGNGVSLIYPERFAIYNKPDSVTLVAQSLNLLRSNNQFIIEIDTTPDFNSPWLQRTMPAINTGNIVKWTVPIMNLDSQVYFWRGRINLPSGQGGFWEERSFIYIKDANHGWSQSDFRQFAQSAYEPHEIILDKISQQFEFSQTERFIWVDTRVNSHTNLGVKHAGFLSQDVNPKADGSFIAVLYNKNTLEQMLHPNHYPKCWLGATWPPFQAAQEYAYYCYANNASGIADFGSLIDDLQEGTYVALFTRYDSKMSTWSPQLKSILNELGAESFEGYGKDQAAFVMIGKKGSAKGTAYENISHLTDSATLGYAAVEGKILGRYDKGSLTSEIIGPAEEWGEAFFDWIPMKGTPATDEMKFSVIGIDSSKNSYVLFQNISSSSLDLSSINAETYPFIKLKADFKDLDDRSAPQIRHWLVTYDRRPEGTINTSYDYSFHADTLQEGDTFRIKIGFQNISEKNMDSVLYNFEIVDLSTQDVLMSVSKKGNPIEPEEAVFINEKMSTKGMQGRYIANINFNPEMEQPEMSLSNNMLSIPFMVNNDNLNPLLDVTFDGKYIMNGEIVSPNPLILISSKDENKFLLQTDTSGFEVQLRSPGNQTFVPIDMGTDEINFKPATTSDNTALIEYRPRGLADGKYTIRVQSKDASGNLAGKEAYTIDFQVVNESTITNFYPYPNPFTTQMRFVFTLTGKEIPDDIRIKIMTISGKVVREISKDELGFIRVGNNISEFAWDGTDQFGDRLANGVYLYQVTVKNHNETLKHRESAGDNSFVKGTGKIYLLR